MEPIKRVKDLKIGDVFKYNGRIFRLGERVLAYETGKSKVYAYEAFPAPFRNVMATLIYPNVWVSPVPF